MPQAEEMTATIYLLTLILSDPSTPEPSQRSWPMMGGILSIEIFDGSQEQQSAAFQSAHKIVSELNRQASTYQPDTEVSKINKEAGTNFWTSVHPLHFQLMQESLRFSRISNGLFDIGVGTLVQLWGFDKAPKGESRMIPTSRDINEALKNVGPKCIELHESDLKIRLKCRGASLDYGAIAKGFALDLAKREIEKTGVKSYVIRLGEQLFISLSTPKEIFIRDPSNPSLSAGKLLASKGSVSTSAHYERYFVHKGKRYSHVLDPRTGWPTTELHSVTVLAPTGIEADAWSTILLIAGPHQGKELLTKAPQVQAVWIQENTKKVITHNVVMFQK